MYTIANGVILKGKNLKPVKENILIDDGKIIEISKEVKEGEIIDASGCIVCPSFLNSHTHIGDSIIMDQGYGLSLDEMVKPPNGIKHKALSNTSDEEIINEMKKSMYRMLESGTTHFIDYREGNLKGVKLLKEASKDIPINPIILGRDNIFFEKDPNLHEVKIVIRHLLKYADGIAPSGFGEISNDVAKIIVDECNKKGKLSSIHAGESKKAQLNSLKKFNKTEIERAIELGFNQIVHCTNLMNNDLNKIINSNSNITLCPRANATLGVGISPLNQFFNRGLLPSIGTDNLMLNSPNMFKELEFSSKLMSACYGLFIDPKFILKMATISSFKSHISENLPPELFIVKQISKNPFLSIINRSETKNIIYVFNKYIINLS